MLATPGTSVVTSTAANAQTAPMVDQHSAFSRGSGSFTRRLLSILFTCMKMSSFGRARGTFGLRASSGRFGAELALSDFHKNFGSVAIIFLRYLSVHLQRAKFSASRRGILSNFLFTWPQRTLRQRSRAALPLQIPKLVLHLPVFERHEG